MNDKTEIHDGEWVAREARNLIEKFAADYRGATFNGQDIATDLGLSSMMDCYSPRESAAIFCSVLEGSLDSDEPGKLTPVEISPDSLYAYEVDGFAWMSADRAAVWCAKWVAQYVDEETAQSMYDDFERGGVPHHTTWEP